MIAACHEIIFIELHSVLMSECDCDILPKFSLDRYCPVWLSTVKHRDNASGSFRLSASVCPCSICLSIPVPSRNMQNRHVHHLISIKLHIPPCAPWCTMQLGGAKHTNRQALPKALSSCYAVHTIMLDRLPPGPWLELQLVWNVRFWLKLSKPAQNRYNVVIESYIFMHRIMFVVIWTMKIAYYCKIHHKYR